MDGTQARNQGGAGGTCPPKKIFAPLGKTRLDIVWNYWTQFKNFWHLSEKSSSLLVAQASYGPDGTFQVYDSETTPAYQLKV